MYKYFFLLIVIFTLGFGFLLTPIEVEALLSVDSIKSVTYWDPQAKMGCNANMADELKTQLPGIKDTGFNAVWLVSWLDCFSTKTFPTPIWDEQAFDRVKDILQILQDNNLKAVLPLNYISSLPGTTVDVCSILAYNQGGNSGYTALKNYVEKYLTEIQSYSNDVIIILFTEGMICDPYENPPVNVSAKVRSTLGRLPLDLPATLRNKFTIGFHDFIFRWSEPGPITAQSAPTPKPNPYDFMSFAYYVNDQETLDAVKNLDTYAGRLKSFYGQSMPVFNGEFGANLCVYGASKQADLTGQLVEYSLSRDSGFNLWQWKGFACGSAGADGFYLNDSSGKALSSRVNVKNLLNQKPAVTSKVLGTIRNNFTGWAGMKFTTGSSAVKVTSLGRIVAPGNTGVHNLKLVNVSGGSDVSGGSTLVATQDGDVGEFRYGALPKAITLPANTSYYLVSQETSGEDQWHDYFDTSVNTTSVISVDGPVWNSVGTWNFILNLPNNTYVPLDLKYTTTGAPLDPPPYSTPYQTPTYATPPPIYPTPSVYSTPSSYQTPYAYPAPSGGDCLPGHLFSSITGRPCVVPPSSTLLTKKLFLGVIHEEVKLLQKYLNSAGFTVAAYGLGSPGNETLYFGLKTRAAVIRFQKARGLVPDGIVGAKTRAVINTGI